MSLRSRLRSYERWFATKEAYRTASRIKQNRRSELLLLQEDCAGCGCRLQDGDHTAANYACLHSPSDLLYCPACVSRASLAQVESEAVQC